MASRWRWGHQKIFRCFFRVDRFSALLMCLLLSSKAGTWQVVWMHLHAHRRKTGSKACGDADKRPRSPNFTNVSGIPFGVSALQPRPRSIIALYGELNLAAAQWNSCKSRAAVRDLCNSPNLHLSPSRNFRMSEESRWTEVTLAENRILTALKKMTNLLIERHQ